MYLLCQATWQRKRNSFRDTAASQIDLTVLCYPHKTCCICYIVFQTHLPVGINLCYGWNCQQMCIQMTSPERFFASCLFREVQEWASYISKPSLLIDLRIAVVILSSKWGILRKEVVVGFLCVRRVSRLGYLN